MSFTIRPGRDADADSFIRLIGDAWAEYPNCVLDVDAEVPELRALAAHFARNGGALWAAEAADGEVVGMVATRPLRDEDEAWEIGRMYVARESRGFRPRHLGALRVLGPAAASLFVRSYERGERVHLAMLSRGYTGRLAGDPAGAVAPTQWAVGLSLPLAAAAVLGAGMLVG